MALNIKNAETERLARELARRRGTSITDAVADALRSEVERERRRVRAPGTAEKLLAIGARYSALPVLDRRSDDAILDYDGMLDRA